MIKKKVNRQIKRQNKKIRSEKKLEREKIAS